jgi:hypothetical protein
MIRTIFSIVLLFWAVASCIAQEPTYPQLPQSIVSDKTYEDVLDTVFPRKQSDDEKTDWTLTLRFMPWTGPESQIFIRKAVSRFIVVEYRSTNGVIFNRLNAWFTEHGREDVADMSKTIEVKRTELTFGRAQFQRWLRGFFRSIRSASRVLENKSHEFDTKGYWSVWLHGSYYETWFDHNVNQVHFVFVDKDPANGLAGLSPLARWMVQVKEQITIAKNRLKQ